MKKNHAKARPGNRNAAKPASARRSTQVAVRMTPIERKRLEAAAAPRRISEYIRVRLGLDP